MNRRRLPLIVAALAAVAATVMPLGPATAQTGPPQYDDDGGPVFLPPSPSAEAPPPSGASVKAGPGQYSAPEWLPLRNQAEVGCVMSNCNFDGQPYHGSWAIDFLDPANQKGDPIYAAGAGQAFINQTGTQCGPSPTPGNSVRVDHGGGVITLYAHLDTFTITDGQWVDQNTQLGTMGTTGIVNPCPAYHLHYDKRLNGTRIDPGPLKACHGSTLVTYPQFLGYTSWDDIPPFMDKLVFSDGTACAGGGGDPAPPADFDGDDDTDVSVFRPTNGQWFIRNGNPSFVVWGAVDDRPVPADYDGDGDVEVAVFRPSNGQWFIRGGDPGFVVWGQSGDIPVPADYDGDGDADIAVFRPSNGQWFIRGGNPGFVVWGQNGDVPVPGDYDGDGDIDIAVFRASNGQWFIRGGNPGFVVWGQNGDIPLPLPTAVYEAFF